MKLVRLIPLVIASLSVTSHTTHAGLNFGTMFVSCHVDSEVQASSRSRIGATALDFMNRLIKGDTQATFALLSEDAKRATPLDRLNKLEQFAIRPMAPYSGTRVMHVYVVQASGVGPDQRAVCGNLNGDDWVSLAVKPNITQAYAEVFTKIRNTDLVYTLWLVPEADSWRINAFHQGIEGTGGKSIRQLLDIARAERKSGHSFNAGVVYGALLEMVNRGPNFQLGIAATIQAETSSLTLPPELRGPPPFTFHVGGGTSAVSLMGIGNQLSLVFVIPHTNWPSDAEVDAQSRNFILAFRKAHPEYASVFKSIIVRAMKPDNSGGFGTVYNEGGGFVSH